MEGTNAEIVAAALTVMALKDATRARERQACINASKRLVEFWPSEDDLPPLQDPNTI